MALAEAFGSKTTSKIIGKEACLGFDSFSDDTSVNVVQCLDDEHVADFVGEYFHDLGWAFGGDMEKVKSELLLWKYASGDNFSYDGIHFTNTAESTVRMLKVFKNHDDTLSCSHWAIVEYGGAFQLAPDVIVWEKSSSSWLGFKTSDEMYTQQVPHKISPQDVQALMLLFDILAFGRLAEARGLSYTWPSLPGCPKQTATPRNGWSWATTPWSNCSKPCGGGQATREVFCVSQSGQTDPTGSHCKSTPRPSAEQPCNEIPCTGKFLVDVMKAEVDRLLKTLPSTPPAAGAAILQRLAASGGHDVVSVPPDQVRTVQNSWMVANSWPSNVTEEFDAIIAAASEQYQAFSSAYLPEQATWTVVIGAARRFNGSVDMAYVSATGTGSPLQQHYGNEKSVQCPAHFLRSPLVCFHTLWGGPGTKLII